MKNLNTADNKENKKEEKSEQRKNDNFWQNNIIRWLIVGNISINIAIWVLLMIFIKPIDAPIILHYNVYFGVDIIGNWKQVFFLPGIGIFIITSNILFAKHFFDLKERIASHILMISSLMAQLCLLIASISVMIINY